LTAAVPQESAYGIALAYTMQVPAKPIAATTRPVALHYLLPIVFVNSIAVVIASARHHRFRDRDCHGRPRRLVGIRFRFVFRANIAPRGGWVCAEELHPGRTRQISWFVPGSRCSTHGIPTTACCLLVDGTSANTTIPYRPSFSLYSSRRVASLSFGRGLLLGRYSAFSVLLLPQIITVLVVRLRQ